MIPCTIAPIRMIEQIVIISFSTLLPAWLQALPAQHISPQIVSQLWQLDLAPHLPSNISQHAPSDYTTVPRQSCGQHKKQKQPTFENKHCISPKRTNSSIPLGNEDPPAQRKTQHFTRLLNHQDACMRPRDQLDFQGRGTCLDAALLLSNT